MLTFLSFLHPFPTVTVREKACFCYKGRRWMLCLTTQNKPLIRKGFSMSLSLFACCGVWAFLWPKSNRNESTHTDIETNHFTIQSKSFPMSGKWVRIDREFGIWDRFLIAIRKMIYRSITAQQIPPRAPGAYGLLQEASPFHGDWKPTLSCVTREKSNTSHSWLGIMLALASATSSYPSSLYACSSMGKIWGAPLCIWRSTAENMILDTLACPSPKRAQKILCQLSCTRYNLIFNLNKKGPLQEHVHQLWHTLDQVPCAICSSQLQQQCTESHLLHWYKDPKLGLT